MMVPAPPPPPVPLAPAPVPLAVQAPAAHPVMPPPVPVPLAPPPPVPPVPRPLAKGPMAVPIAAPAPAAAAGVPEAAGPARGAEAAEDEAPRHPNAPLIVAAERHLESLEAQRAALERARAHEDRKARETYAEWREIIDALRGACRIHDARRPPRSAERGAPKERVWG